MRGFIIAVTILGTTLTGCEKDMFAGTGPGNFKISNTQAFEFQNCDVWADFDRQLSLNGEYTYKAQDDNVFLARYIGGVKIFEYRLEKIHQN